MKTTENKLSDFLKRRRLRLGGTSREYAIAALKRLGRRAVWKHDGKAAIIIDPTAHAKARSRRKIRPIFLVAGLSLRELRELGDRFILSGCPYSSS